MRSRVVLIVLVSLALLGSAVAWYRLSARVGEPNPPWEGRAPMPTARSEMPAAVAGGLIYVPGGLGAFGRTLTTFEAYAPDADEWRTLEPLPLPLHHTGAAGLEGRVFVAGGYTDTSFSIDNDRAWVYDPATDEWSAIAGLPAPRAAHAMVTLDGRIWVVGGVGPAASELWAYDPASDSWERDLAPLPTPREHLTAVAAGGRIFAIGGRSGGDNLVAVEIYDPAEDSWSSGPDMPTARSGLAAAAIGHDIHVAGGEELGGGGTFDTHEILDGDDLEWRDGVPMGSPRHGLAAAAVDRSWYVIGGATRAGGETIVSLTDSVEALSSAEP